MKKRIFIELNLILIVVLSLLLSSNNTEATNTVLGSDKNKVSLGTLTYGQMSEYKEVTIYNNGSENISLAYETADCDNMLIIDAPENLEIKAGESTAFYISTNQALEPGKHSASLYVYDYEDNDYNNYVRIEFTATVLLEAPYVTNLSISPVTGNVTPSGTLQFLSRVATVNNASTKVYWDVQGNYSNDTFIDDEGILHVGSNESAPLLKVTASSQIDSSVYSSALISVCADDFTISAFPSSLDGGYVSQSTTASTGESSHLTAYPYNGYIFLGWYENGDIVCHDCRLTIDDVQENHIYEALFKKTTSDDCDAKAPSAPLENVNISGYSYPQSGGTINGLGIYDCNHETTITATPTEGYEFSYWSLNGDIISTEHTLNIKTNSDVCLKAYWNESPKADNKNNSYTITAGTVSSNGCISYAGNISYNQGTSRLYTIRPASGYTISDVCVDGQSKGAISSYVFRDISDDHFIVANFAPKPASSNPMPRANTDSIKKIVNAYESMNTSGYPKTNNIYGLNIIDQDFIDEKLPEYKFNDRVNASIYDMDEMTDFLKILGLSPVDARSMITAGNSNELLNIAKENGYININVFNEFVYTSDSQSWNQNEANAIAYSYVDEEDINTLINGEPINIGMYIFNATNTISDTDKELLYPFDMSGIKIDDNSFFEILMSKNIQGYTEDFRTLPHPITVKLDIPENLRKIGRTYYILNAMYDANGNPMRICITDEDDSPETITFTTSSLSIYALAYADEPTKSSVFTYSKYTLLIIGLCVMSAIMISLYITIDGIKKKVKRS